MLTREYLKIMRSKLNGPEVNSITMGRNSNFHNLFSQNSLSPVESG